MADITKYEFHEYALMFPKFNEDKFDNLTDSIKKDGLLEPITLYKGKILDGRNRYLACEKLGIEPTVEEFGDAKTDEDALTFVLKRNITRRHLSKLESAIVGLSIIDIEQDRSRQRQLQGAPLAPGVLGGETLEIVGNQVGVSKTIMRQVSDMADNAPDIIEFIKKYPGYIRKVPEALELLYQPYDIRAEVLKRVSEQKEDARKILKEVKNEKAKQNNLQTFSASTTSAAPVSSSASSSIGSALLSDPTSGVSASNAGLEQLTQVDFYKKFCNLLDEVEAQEGKEGKREFYKYAFDRLFSARKDYLDLFPSVIKIENHPIRLNLLPYPGSKSSISHELVRRMGLINNENYEIREPFVGGGNVSLRMLEMAEKKGYKFKIRINDVDKNIAALWNAVINEPDALKKRIMSFNPDMDDLYETKRNLPTYVYEDIEAAVRKLAIHHTTFKCFGEITTILKKGDTKWKAKRNKICNTVDRVHKLVENKVREGCCTSYDAIDVINEPEACMIFADPPYVQTGRMYSNSYDAFGHKELADALDACVHPWVLTYDYDPMIYDLYEPKGHHIFPVALTYPSEGKKGKKHKAPDKIKEYWICSRDSLKLLQPEFAETFDDMKVWELFQ